MKRSLVMAVRSDSFAGVEQYICGAVAELDRRGWEVVVVGGAVDEMARRLPPSVQRLPATTTADVMKALMTLGRRPLVHAHMTAAEIAAVTTRPWTRATIVSTRHFAAARGSSPALRIVMRVLGSAIAGQVAISTFVAERVEGSSRVILNGVPGSESTHDTSARTVLVMQRLEPEKDTSTALRAWQLSRLQDDGWKLEIVGRGACREALEAQARALGIAQSVNFAGFTAEPTASRRSASVFLATATAEPYGLAVVEAMAQGLPVVATDAGAHPETVGPAGLLFPAGDASACAEHLRRLAHDEVDRSRLSEAAIARHREHLTIEAHVDALEDFYAAVAGGAR